MRRKTNTIKIVLKVLWILFAILSIVIWVPKIDKLLTKDYSLINNYVSLDDSWDITINDDTYHNVALNDYYFPEISKGSQIIMQRALPENWGIQEGVLRLSTRHSAVKVYIDDELIYEYGYDRMAENKTVGSGFLFINFPESYQGKIIRIQLCQSEDKAFTKLDSIRIYSWENAYRVLMTENRFPLFFGSFLFIFGLAVSVMTIFAITFSRKYIRILCISFFSLCMGLWTMCYYRVISIYSIPLYSVSLMEHVALYLAPVPLVIYMHAGVKNLNKKFLKILYWAALDIHIAALMVMMALHMADVIHLASMLPCMAGIIVFWLIFFFIVIGLNFKSSKMINRLYLAGILVVSCCTIYDMIGYGSNRYFGDSSLMEVKGVSSIGVMFFIFILFLSFYIELTKKMMLETERNSLIKSAYTDELTQLHNRRYCMEYMSKLREEKNSDYTVVCFDLNNLKTINDTYGHAKGDILIKSAADVLSETFTEHGIVARMGGDEFIAIINMVEMQQVETLLMLLQRNIDRKNRQIEALNMSIACGYASGTEGYDDIEKAYQAADDRMYECKRRMKKI